MPQPTAPGDPPEVLGGFRSWVKGGRDDPARMEGRVLEEYFEGVAEARYVIRKVFRLVDDQAKTVGLEPLEHQALIQIIGGYAKQLRVIDLAERLDIAPAFASRLAKRLEDEGLVTRSASPEDKRSTVLETTSKGRELLADIDGRVHFNVEHFQRQLTHPQRVAALGIFAFYLGAAPSAEDLRQLLARDG